MKRFLKLLLLSILTLTSSAVIRAQGTVTGSGGSYGKPDSVTIIDDTNMYPGDSVKIIDDSNMYPGITPLLGETYIYPENPAPGDSLTLTYVYVSTDGCPDFFLSKDSVAPGFIGIKLNPIVDTTRFCTMAITKMKTSINLGVIGQTTNIYLNHLYIKTILPACDLNRVGKVISTDQNATIIEEDSTKQLFQIFNATLKPGITVKFNGTVVQCIKAPCYGIVNCYRIIDVPVVNFDRKGIIVQGSGDCANELFIEEFTPLAVAIPQLWKMTSLTPYAYFKPGEYVIFSGNKISYDSIQRKGCNVIGYATFIRKVGVTPPPPVEATYLLTGKAMADSVDIKYGYAVLFGKGQRKALASTQILNGNFDFKGVKDSSYTVFVVPDKYLIPGFLPTFYIDKLYLKDADYVKLTDSITNIQMHLMKHMRHEGKGIITGRIHYENNGLVDSTLIKNGIYISSTDTTDKSACNITVMLLDSTKTPVSWTLTDNLGNYTFTNIQPGKYTVVAETGVAMAVSSANVDSTSTSTADVNLTLKSNESFTELKQATVEKLQIYPNPAVSTCIVTVPMSGEMRIYNLNGQMVQTFKLNTGINEININDLKSGMYIVKTGNEVIKLIKK